MNQTTHHAPRLTATAGIPASPVALPRGGEFLTCRLPASVARISVHPTYPLRATAGPLTPPASFPRPIKALSVSAGTPTAPVSLRRGGEFLTCRLPSPRAAFTLVELLVVIGIIATLAALVTPAVMRAQSAARNAAIKAEIDMLHMAIMNYKNEYGSFPPCVDRLYRGPDSSAWQNQYPPGPPAGEAVSHLRRLFPRCNAVNAELNAASVNDPSRTSRTSADELWLAYLYAPNPPPADADLHLNPHNAIVAWLGGYSSQSNAPLTGAGRRKLFDFDQSRVSSSPSPLNFYSPSGKPNAPYIYIDASHYSAFLYAGVPNNIPGAERRIPSEFFNPDSFQILCAGRDETFGTDDDLSNFWPGTRRDYLDSLRN
jgi:prepilin-type N-terminal cleavage/methylation domain-containing protein